MSIRGVRGATIASENTVGSIYDATKELLVAMMEANPTMVKEEIACVIFTMTPDLDAAYPAAAARQLGWNDVPLLCAQELNVPDGLGRCIRVLLLWNTEISSSKVHHVYLKEAKQLRGDLAQ